MEPFLRTLENLAASFKADIASDEYYDVLALTYMTETQGAKALTNATKSWVFGKCKSERFLLTVFYGMSMVLYGPIFFAQLIFGSRLWMRRYAHSHERKHAYTQSPTCISLKNGKVTLVSGQSDHLAVMTVCRELTQIWPPACPESAGSCFASLPLFRWLV